MYQTALKTARLGRTGLITRVGSGACTGQVDGSRSGESGVRLSVDAHACRCC